MTTKNQLRRDYFWNTAASLMSSLSVVVMLMAVTRATDVATAGIFALAIAIGQQFQTLGMYEIRTYHVTDVKYMFTFGTYASTRIITVVLMTLGIIGYSLVTQPSLNLALLLILVASLRIFDAAEDVFYSEFQRQGRLDIAGMTCFIRLFTTTVTFAGSLALWNDLLYSTILTLVISTVVFIGAYIPPARKIYSLKPAWERAKIIHLLIECLPLFLASFLAMFVANAPRYAIDYFLDDQAQGYFAIIYMPAVAINMLSLFIFRPLLVPLAQRWTDGDRAGFMRMIKRGLYGTSAAFILVAIVGVFAGPFILKLVFGKDVSHLLLELVILILAGYWNASATILYYALTTIRHQHLAFIGFALTSVIITILCIILIPMMFLLGATLAYAIAMLALCLIFGYLLLRVK